jgi:hypothetical protein
MPCSTRTRSRWNQACRRGAAPDEAPRTASPRDEALSKRDFIGLYLSSMQGARAAVQHPGLQGGA